MCVFAMNGGVMKRARVNEKSIATKKTHTLTRTDTRSIQQDSRALVWLAPGIMRACCSAICPRLQFVAKVTNLTPSASARRQRFNNRVAPHGNYAHRAKT